ncbi:tRNA pseudouridine(38/39) synthase-like [Histomonas meleagridis]|uniref:tRNA pseudouridine(38/39) synthase-like n=1 Tax=Histomonas meleagridis TaxID=135588 RepID=UPI00355AA478|nr:tRNA pseudouridine(38/39) synthase-like [Histomonas meleagridis]KAH0799081.1 tRNA pseudouridine(38/39) synthase-like [Histomonas meleagridis]
MSVKKAKKVFSWDQYHERQIALRINYLGCDLKGFVHQQTTTETVENYLFQAFERARLIKDRNDCHYSLCGRTDAGVSGIGNVISIRVRSVYPYGTGSIKNEGAPIKEEEINYVQILNGILPPIIRVTAIAYVNPDFNARFECTSRSYRYLFHLFDMDIEKMREAASYLIGTHDYRNFCKFSPSNTTHCIREIYSIDFNEINDGVWYFQICGSGFIWHQIRCIAAILFLIGQGLEEPSLVTELLDINKFPGRPQYQIADPEPLVFWMAEYDNLEWKESNEPTGKFKFAFNEMLKKENIKCALLTFFNGGKAFKSEGPKSYTPVAKLQQCKSVEELIEEYRKEKDEQQENDEGFE